MKKIESLAVSSYNEKTRPLVRENIQAWLPFSNHVFTLWPAFAGEGRYVKGHWCKHDSFEKFDIQLVLEGDLKVWFDGSWHLLKSGDAGIIPHGPHRLATGPTGFCLKKCIGIQGIISKILARQFNLDSFHIIHHFPSSEFDVWHDRIRELLAAKDFSAIPELSRLAYSVMMYVVTRRHMEELPPELILCNQFIEQNIGKPIAVSDLCRAAGCGKTTLTTLFRKHFGESPIAHLIKLRVEFAARQLEGNALPIKEVAQLCGYRNQLYFSCDFKKHFGVPPREYRRTKESETS